MKAILIDVTRCIGCERCVQACKRENGLGPDRPYRWLEDDGLSAVRWLSVTRRGRLFVRKQCRHCLEPACVSACPVGALARRAEGAVTYDADRCMGCRYCMMACPFGIPRYDWESAVPTVRKCQLCFSGRLSEGKPPACVEACPVEAVRFGDRDELLAHAESQIAGSPGRYLARVIGQSEVGGTCVLYLSPVDLDFLALGNKLDDRPMPERTIWAMTAVPPVFLGVGAILGGIYWLIERRMRLARERLQPAAEGERATDRPDDEPEERGS